MGTAITGLATNPPTTLGKAPSGFSRLEDGHAWDGEAGLKLVLGSHLVVSGGYRYFDLQVNDKPDFATLKNSGPFVGAGLRL